MTEIESLRAEVARLKAREAEAEARGMERAMPTDRAIQDLSDHMWRVHPRELDEGGYVSKRFGGKYENPLAAWYADQIKALCRGSAIRAEAAAIRRAAEGEKRINWRDGPGAIVEDDEPQTGRAYE